MIAFLFFWVSLLASGPARAEVKVVTSTQDLKAITEAVGGSNVSVFAITRGDMDPHFVDAKPSYMVKLASADLVIAVGMELEIGWLPSLVTGSRNPKIVPGTQGYLDASTAITPIEVPTGTIDRSRGDLHPLGNPHYWLDPENGRKVARSIAERLSSIDPTHAAEYRAGLEGFETDLTAREAVWQKAMAPLAGAAVVGYHATFDYFCAHYGLQVVGFVEPKPGIPPTPSHTLEVAGKAKAAGATMVLIETFHNPATAQPVAGGAGARVVTVPTSVGAQDGIVTYFDLLDRVVRAVTVVGA